MSAKQKTADEFDPSRFFTVASGEVEAYRAHLAPVLSRIERFTDQVTADDVLAQAAQGHAQLWCYASDGQVSGVAATRLHQLPRGRLCSIWAVAGFDVVPIAQSALQEIEAWALAQGCYGIELVCREGWQRVLPAYRRTAVVLERSLAGTH